MDAEIAFGTAKGGDMQRRKMMFIGMAIAAIIGLGVRPGLANGPYRVVDLESGGQVVVDEEQNLVWQQSDGTPAMDWAAAQTACTSLPLAGGGWRLPDSEALRSLVDTSQGIPAIDPVFACKAADYWTADEYDSLRAWFVDFLDGSLEYSGKLNAKLVRCVQSAIGLQLPLKGAGDGQVRVSLAGQMCTTNCTSFLKGETVTLTAVPEDGYVFLGWVGACSGNNPVCTLTMDSDKEAAAWFGFPGGNGPLDPDGDLVQTGDPSDPGSDNCPTDFNPDQANDDNDQVGDACEATDDADDDGISSNPALPHPDNCPTFANSDQIDTDNDGIGDACEATDDADDDGVSSNPVLPQPDNCPDVYNPLQEDTNHNGIGDACEASGGGGTSSFPWSMFVPAMTRGGVVAH